MNVLLAVTGVAVVASAVYVISTNHAPAKSEHGAAGAPTTSRSKADPPSSKPTKKPKPLVVAFLGDDWTAGIGASSHKHRFTTLVSHDLQVTERNFGADGTGYAKATSSDGDYTAGRRRGRGAPRRRGRVRRPQRRDNLLATVASRARSLFDDLHSKLPDATLVAVAPMWGDSDKPPEVVAVGQAVKSAVTAAGGKYLDIADPIHGHPGLMADAGDPDDDGYAAIAAALEPKLKALLPNWPQQLASSTCTCSGWTSGCRSTVGGPATGLLESEHDRPGVAAGHLEVDGEDRVAALGPDLGTGRRAVHRDRGQGCAAGGEVADLEPVVPRLDRVGVRVVPRGHVGRKPAPARGWPTGWSPTRLAAIRSRCAAGERTAQVVVELVAAVVDDRQPGVRAVGVRDRTPRGTSARAGPRLPDRRCRRATAGCRQPGRPPPARRLVGVPGREKRTARRPGDRKQVGAPLRVLRSLREARVHGAQITCATFPAVTRRSRSGEVAAPSRRRNGGRRRRVDRSQGAVELLAGLVLPHPQPDGARRTGNAGSGCCSRTTGSNSALPYSSAKSGPRSRPDTAPCSAVSGSNRWKLIAP